MFGASSPFGQSSNSPFGSPSVFGQNNSPNNNPFAAKPFGSTSPFGAQTGSSIFGGTSTGVFGAQASAPAFGASSTPAFGSSMPAFGASSSPAFGASSSSFGGSSVFGQKPAFGGFGSTTPSSPFGGSFQQQSQPAFGSNLFGSSPFGATSQPAFGASSTPAFGASSTPAFGATSTPAFGATSTPAFGAPSTPAFGATSTPAFGSTSTPTFGNTGSAFGTSVFGSSTPAFGASSTPAFGAASTSAFGSSSTPAFGASSTPAFGSSPTPAFGATSSPFSFGQSTSAFGSTQFGATSTPFGAQSSPFGAQTTTPAFGSPGFGQQSFAGQQRGGTRVTPYSQTPEADSGSGTQPAGKLESISAMPAYKEKSHEELRWEDYQLGDKGGPNPAGQSSGGMGFNMNNTQQSNPFASSTPAFGQSSANPFSSTTSTNPFAPKTSTFSTTGFASSTSTLSSSPFSATPSNPFGSTPTPAPSPFGSTSAFGSNPGFTSATSGSLFNTTSSSPFGTSTSLFNTQAQGATSSFGTGLNFGNTQSSPLFQSSTPALGQTSSPFGQAPSAFGQAPSAFGQSTPAFGQSNPFGGNMFSSTPSLLSTSSMGFNQTTDHRKGPQNMFRPLLSSVPTSNFYTGKSSPAWNSSVTTSSNASSDLGTSGPHDIEEHEHIDDDATSGITKVPNSDVNDEEIFMFEKNDSLNEDTNTMQCDTATSVVLDDFNGRDDTLVCSRCGCEYPVTTPTEDDVKLCLNCQKSTSDLTINDTVSEANTSTLDKDHEFVNDTVKPRLTIVKHEELVHDQLNHDEISQSSLSYSDTRGEQIQQTVDFQKSNDESIEGKGISTILERCSSVKGPVTRSRNFSASSISYDALSYMSASSSVDFGPRLQSQLSSRRSDMENYKYDPVNAKHRRSMSSLSATSGHAFHPSSVGTSTLDSFDVSVVRVERDVADSASVGPQENVDSVEVLLPEIVNDDNVFDVRVERDVADSASVGPQENASENDMCAENVDSVEVLLPELVNDDKVFDVRVKRDVADSASVGPQENLSENVDSAEVLNNEEPALVLKDEELGKDTDALVTCTVEESTSLTGSSSPASQCHVLQHSECSIEELQDPHVSDAVSKDMAVSDMDINNLNHSSGINEESTVLVEGQGGTKGRSLTLDEATDTILFCSSIIHNLAYEAANIAIEKQTPPEPSENNDFPPLVPAVTKSYPDRKDLQTRKTSKRSSKSQKTRKKPETDTVKTPNNVNTDEETELHKTRIVYSNNKENTKPPTLEAKCNCRIM